MFHTESLTLGLISAGCIFGGVLVGLLLRNLLPDHHLEEESKDTIKLGAGMIATVSALVLGLLVASAKDTFDATEEELTQRASKIIFLDHLLADYGPETKATREELRRTVAASIEMISITLLKSGHRPERKSGDGGNFNTLGMPAFHVGSCACLRTSCLATGDYGATIPSPCWALFFVSSSRSGRMLAWRRFASQTPLLTSRIWSSRIGKHDHEQSFSVCHAAMVSFMILSGCKLRTVQLDQFAGNS